jgi:hypothetical protein
MTIRGLEAMKIRMQPALEHSHSRQAIHERLTRGPRTNYLRDWIYGGIDGAVTTFAIVAGSLVLTFRRQCC